MFKCNPTSSRCITLLIYHRQVWSPEPCLSLIVSLIGASERPWHPLWSNPWPFPYITVLSLAHIAATVPGARVINIGSRMCPIMIALAATLACRGFINAIVRSSGDRNIINDLLLVAGLGVTIVGMYKAASVVESTRLLGWINTSLDLGVSKIFGLICALGSLLLRILIASHLEILVSDLRGGFLLMLTSSCGTINLYINTSPSSMCPSDLETTCMCLLIPSETSVADFVEFGLRR